MAWPHLLEVTPRSSLLEHFLSFIDEIEYDEEIEHSKETDSRHSREEEEEERDPKERKVHVSVGTQAGDRHANGKWSITIELIMHSITERRTHTNTSYWRRGGRGGEVEE